MVLKSEDFHLDVIPRSPRNDGENPCRDTARRLLPVAIGEGVVLDLGAMIKEYFRQLIGLWLHPVEFFSKRFDPEDEKAATRFSVLTGVLVTLEFGAGEALGGGSLGIVALVTLLLLVLMPFLVTVWIYAWTAFLKLCAFLLEQELDMERVRRVVAFSLAGLAALAVGFGLGKWLALAMFVFQVFGVERVQKCSRWTAAVFVGLPFSLMAVLVLLGALMFKVFR
jgi:hypothetical protein